MRAYYIINVRVDYTFRFDLFIINLVDLYKKKNVKSRLINIRNFRHVVTAENYRKNQQRAITITLAYDPQATQERDLGRKRYLSIKSDN